MFYPGVLDCVPLNQISRFQFSHLLQSRHNFPIISPPSEIFQEHQQQRISSLLAGLHSRALLSTWTVERLFCKRPILCLASSKILTPPPPSLPGEYVTPAILMRGGHPRWVEGGGCQYLEDARHSSVLYICKYFVTQTIEGTRTRSLCILSRTFKVMHRSNITEVYCTVHTSTVARNFLIMSSICDQRFFSKSIWRIFCI